MSNHKEITVGIIGQFKNPAKLIDAAKKVREAGYEKYDCHSPFPIHGMDSAMGLKRSKLGWFVGMAAFIGTVSALILQGWTSTFSYPLVISGKPLFSYQAYVPITFALGVLLSAFTALIMMLILNGLPRLNHPVFNSDNFSQFSNDAFFISIEADDAKFEQEKAISFLESLGATNCEILRESEE